MSIVDVDVMDIVSTTGTVYFISKLMGYHVALHIMS